MKGSKEGVERDENMTQEEAERLENKQSEPFEELMKDEGDWMEPFPDVDKS